MKYNSHMRIILYRETDSEVKRNNEFTVPNPFNVHHGNVFTFATGPNEKVGETWGWY